MKYTFWQRATLNGKTVCGKILSVSSKQKALKLINEWNKLYSGKTNLKQVLDFTNPFDPIIENLKMWNTKDIVKKELNKLSKYNGINIENVVYLNKAFAVTKTK